MKTSIHSLIIIALILLSQQTLAYSPEVAHTPLTTLSFFAYAKCTGDTTTYKFKDHDPSNRQRLIVSGNRAMDLGINVLDDKYKESNTVKKLFPKKLRIFNWHFYNPRNNDIRITKRGFVKQSQRILWTRAKDSFKKMMMSDEKYLYLGAIIHLLEDTGVPAHVVPVYHGPKLGLLRLPIADFKSLTDYLKKSKRYKKHSTLIKDAVDYMQPDNERLKTKIKEEFSPLNDFCKALVKEKTSPDAIRDKLANSTLDSLKKPIDQCGNVTWNVFWNNDIRDRKNKYFKGYNINVPEFNEKGLIKQSNVEGSCEMKKNDNRYINFAFKRHIETIKADVRLLNWAKNIFKRIY